MIFSEPTESFPIMNYLHQFTFGIYPYIALAIFCSAA